MVSFAFHIFLMVMFLLISIGFDFEAPDFAEVSFVSGEPLLTGAPPPGAITRQREEIIPHAPEQPPAEQTSEEEVVKIPKRRMLEDEEPEILARKIDKQTATDKRPTVPTKREAKADAQSQLPVVGERTRGEKITPGATRMDLADKDIAQSGIGTGGETELPFQIEGEASQRSILHKVIPNYPQGLQTEATLKVRFSVLPDGTVGKMIPVIKGNNVLESLTLDALRQWRFNSIPKSAPQREVEGIITFRYILR